MNPSKLHSCPLCRKVMLKKNLYTHLRVIHKSSPEEVLHVQEQIAKEVEAKGEGTVICPICDVRCATFESLAKHCGEAHSEDGAEGRPQDYDVGSWTFDSEEGYKRWLDEICERTCTSLYVWSKETLPDFTRRRMLCNRAGVYKTKATKRAAVSKKDVQYCSCFVTVQFYKDGKVSAKGCFGHVGHEIDPALLRLSIRQREYLRILLEEHSLDYVIKRFRNEDPSKLSRLCYIVKQDLRNIIAQYNMMPGWRHENDVTSTQMRYDEKNLDDDIRVFEPPDQNGKGFLMVIITPLMLGWLRQFSSRGVTLDDTFHTTRYNVRLATLMVPDDKDRGLPGAFLLSGSMTTEGVRRLFVEIRSLMPEFSPRTLVTDEAPCLYKGYRAVFPDSATRLHYCRYHVRQAWERKTKELAEVSIRPTVNSALHGLLKETQLAEFQRRFAEILVYLRAKKQGPMADYLEKNYLGNTPTWASFANKDAVMDTTMISERSHLRIKDEFLHRNANSRIDSFVDLLIKSVEDMSDSIDIKDRRRFVNSAYRITETRKRHKTAVDLYSSQPGLIVRLSVSEWKVSNRTHTKEFLVVWDGYCECNPEKNIHCLTCGVCPYTWSCTCSDNRAGISCPHRHAVKLVADLPQRDSGQPATQIHDTSSLTAPEEEQGPSAETPVTLAQERQEARYQKLSTIKSTYAVINSGVTALAKVDTEEAMQKLEEVLAYLELAAGVVQPSIGHVLAPRPEMAEAGGKPQLSKIPLYQRRKQKKQKNLAETEDLHRELQAMLGGIRDDSGSSDQ